MGLGVDLEELVDGDLGVEGGGVEFGVAEELLDEPDVSPVFEHVSGAGVAKEVTGAAARDGLVDEFGDEAAEGIGVEGLAEGGEEEGLGGSCGFELGP